MKGKSLYLFPLKLLSITKKDSSNYFLEVCVTLKKKITHCNITCLSTKKNLWKANVEKISKSGIFLQREFYFARRKRFLPSSCSFDQTTLLFTTSKSVLGTPKSVIYCLLCSKAIRYNDLLFIIDLYLLFLELGFSILFSRQ